MGSRLGLAIRDAARALAARRSREEDLEAESSDEAGFTLIELMVVLLIMGILMAIAIPTFLGAASGAHDKASQSDLTNSMTSAKSIYASNGTYTDTVGGTTKFAATELHKAEPEMTYGTATGTKATVIAVAVKTANVLVMASYSGTTQNCWLAVDNETASKAKVNTVTATPGISYGLKKSVTKHTTCTAASVPGTWTRSYPKA